MDHAQGQLTAVNAANPQDHFLTFTSANWSVPQTVLVTAVDDGIEEGRHEAYISHIIDTIDNEYLEAFALQELVVIRETATAVVDRRIFYNGSTFDGYDISPGDTDDAAVAPTPDELTALGQDPAFGKTPLLPGQQATFRELHELRCGDQRYHDRHGRTGSPGSDHGRRLRVPGRQQSIHHPLGTWSRRRHRSRCGWERASAVPIELPSLGPTRRLPSSGCR